jgi:uncharacterized protein (TIGR02453 family)
MAASAFSPALFSFLRELRRNNDRDWFAANKPRYERDVRDASLRFIGDFAPRLAKIAPHLVADARPVGGSMFRIYRDTRFSHDKSPYKIHIGIHFFHESAKKAPSVPGFYLHLQPGESFAAAGIWHPDPAALARVREAIATDAPGWKALRKAKLPIEGGALKRPPRGFAPDHPFLEDLKRTDFVTSLRFTDREIIAPSFLTDFTAACKKMSPLVKFVSQAMRLEW